MKNKNDTGIAGENVATRFLASIGYIIVERNWRYRRFEIDIIARDGDTMVFVEVKARTTNSFGEPEVFVTPRKQGFLVAAAHFYLTDREISLESRFDIVSVLFINDVPHLKHLPGAFRAVAK